MDRLGDSRVTQIVYETIFLRCKEMTVDRWNHDDSYSNYLALLNAAFFDALAYKLHVRDSYKNCMKSFYGEETYDNLVESLYEKHLDDLCWDADVELDVLDELIADSKSNSTFDSSEKEAFFDATERMEDIRREHYKLIDEEDDKEGFELIVQKTGIREQKCVNIGGFECHFCEAKISDDEYIIVYQNETRISNIIDKEDEWKKFQHDLYYEDIKNGQSSAMVYIVYILDGDSNNIPIQVIESNKTYGRKYVFTEEETITFINGIVKTSHDEIGAVSPVQVWDRILREEHLTGCLTEAYASKKVEAYLAGQRFDADYVQEDDYSSLTHSDVPQIKWVKSLDTTGFRNFCFNNTVMEFGQINLFYGANGSGKTSVLEAIEYALTAEARQTSKIVEQTASQAGSTAAGSAAGPYGVLIGYAAGKEVSKKVDKVSEKKKLRNRKISFFLDKMRAQENQQDSLFKLAKDLIAGKLIVKIKGAIALAAAGLVLMLLLVSVIIVPVTAVVAVIYNSPFAIFFPPLEAGDTVITVTGSYVSEFNREVNDLINSHSGCDMGMKVYVDYEGSASVPSNNYDIMAVYMVKYGVGDTATIMM